MYIYICKYIYIYCSSFYHKVTVSWPQTISHRHIISWPQHLLMFLHLGFIPSGSNMCRRKRAPIYDLFHGEKGWNRMECDCFPYVYSDKSKWSKCLVSGYCNNPCWSMLIHVIIFIPSRDRHRRAPPSLSRPKSLRAGRSPLRMKHDEPPSSGYLIGKVMINQWMEWGTANSRHDPYSKPLLFDEGLESGG